MSIESRLRESQYKDILTNVAEIDRGAFGSFGLDTEPFLKELRVPLRRTVLFPVLLGLLSACGRAEAEVSPLEEVARATKFPTATATLTPSVEVLSITVEKEPEEATATATPSPRPTMRTTATEKPSPIVTATPSLTETTRPTETPTETPTRTPTTELTPTFIPTTEPTPTSEATPTPEYKFEFYDVYVGDIEGEGKVLIAIFQDGKLLFQSLKSEPRCDNRNYIPFAFTKVGNFQPDSFNLRVGFPFEGRIVSGKLISADIITGSISSGQGYEMKTAYGLVTCPGAEFSFKAKKVGNGKAVLLKEWRDIWLTPPWQGFQSATDKQVQDSIEKSCGCVLP